MKYIFHIGLHKTGTSYIQKVLSDNRRLLLEYNCLYPESIASGTNHGNFANTFKSADAELSLNEIEKLKIEFNESNADMVMISSECFLETPNVAGNLKERFHFDERDDVEFIVYLRSPVEWFESLYNEIVRDPYRRYCGDVFTSREYNSGYYDYKKILAPWKEIFTDAKFLFLNYESILDKKSDIAGELLLNVLPDIDLSKFSFARRAENKALKPPYVHLLQRINRVPIHIVDYRRIVHKLNQLSDMDSRKYGRLLSVEEIAKIQYDASALSESRASDSVKDYRCSRPSYQISNQDLRDIFAKLPEDLQSLIKANAHSYTIDFECLLSEQFVHQEQQKRERLVFDRQNAEFVHLYNLPEYVLKDDELLEDAIINQRCLLRQNKFHFSDIYSRLFLLPEKVVSIQPMGSKRKIMTQVKLVFERVLTRLVVRLKRHNRRI